MHTMKKTTRHEARKDGRLARMVAVWALWLAAGPAQAQILVSATDTTHWVKSPPAITNVRIVPGDENATIQFDVKWTGSWRNDLNHDAAWIFFKVRPEGAKEWQHIRLAADPPPSRPQESRDSGAARPSSAGASGVLNPKGYACEGNRKMDFLVPVGEDGYTGMFVRQAGQSSPCSISLTNVTAIWNLSKSKGIGRDTKVHLVAVCIKMVYIAEGPFYLGSGGTETAGWYEYPEPWKARAATFAITNGNATIVAHEGVDDAVEYPAYRVKNAGPIPTGKKPGLLWARGEEPAEGEIPATFPNGYAAFYVMAMAIHASDYVIFLNTVPSKVADDLYDKETGYGDANGRAIYREGTGPDYTYTQMSPQGQVWGGPPFGMRWLSWERGASYAAWAGLRPFTELEFEKYLRGPRQPVPDESHHSFWGLQTRLMRRGFPRERPVTAAKTEAWDPATFKGSHGLGTADLPADWPQKNAVGVGSRGGWNRTPEIERTSARGKMTWFDPDPDANFSFRGARTAPGDAAKFSEEE